MSSTSNRCFLGLTICLFHTSILLAQRENTEFQRLSSEDGLSQNQVSCIYQDSRGFMWFGTQDGLNRYDGYEFKVYRHNPENPYSLSDYAINVITEDSTGALWIGTREGLNRFDREKETFMHFRPDPGNPRSLPDNRVWSIYFDSEAVLWAGTSKGLCRFNLATGKLRSFLCQRWPVGRSI